MNDQKIESLLDWATCVLRDIDPVVMEKEPKSVKVDLEQHSGLDTVCLPEEVGVQ